MAVLTIFSEGTTWIDKGVDWEHLDFNYNLLIISWSSRLEEKAWQNISRCIPGNWPAFLPNMVRNKCNQFPFSASNCYKLYFDQMHNNKDQYLQRELFVYIIWTILPQRSFRLSFLLLFSLKLNLSLDWGRQTAEVNYYIWQMFVYILCDRLVSRGRREEKWITTLPSQYRDSQHKPNWV